MSIETLDGSRDPSAELCAALIDCWVEVSNTGGAVGFPFPPVSRAQVEPVFDGLAEDLRARRVVLFVCRVDTRLAGWVVLRPMDDPLMGHVGLVERLQTHPRHRGAGHAAGLLEAVERYAVETAGLRQLHLTVRGAMGLEAFYERWGWREVGRWPHALRLSADDFRDDVMMFKSLDPQA